MDAIVLAQQTKITELEHSRTLDRTDIDYLTTNITDLESQRESDQVMIENQNTTITQMHMNLISQASAVVNNTYLLISLETGIALDRTLLQNLSDRTALLEYNRQSDLTTMEDTIERVTDLENKQTEINNTLQSLGILNGNYFRQQKVHDLLDIRAPSNYCLRLVSTDIFSLTKIVCHRHFGNEFAFTQCKDYLYYLARSHLSQIFDNETSQQIYTRIFFCDKPTLSKKKCPWKRDLKENFVLLNYVIDKALCNLGPRVRNLSPQVV